LPELSATSKDPSLPSIKGAWFGVEMFKGFDYREFQNALRRIPQSAGNEVDWEAQRD